MGAGHQGNRYPATVVPFKEHSDIVEKRWEEYGFKRGK